MFKKATRKQSKLRLTIDGPAGSGKTYTALRFAHALTAAFGGRIAAIDTERGSMSKYVGETPDGVVWDFDVEELASFSPEAYTNAIRAAGAAGYTVLVIDSLSHAWEGVGGALEIKDRQGGNQWAAWRAVTPIHNRMVDAILQAPLHIITTMRSTMEYVQETDGNGRVSIKKVGMAPRQRPGMEYEFDIVADIDWAHILKVSKSRCSAVADATNEKPGAEFMAPVIAWLSSGEKEETNTPALPNTPQHAPPAPPRQHRQGRQGGEQAGDLMALLETYSAEEIMDANGGQIPQTEAEVILVAAKLEEALV